MYSTHQITKQLQFYFTKENHPDYRVARYFLEVLGYYSLFFTIIQPVYLIAVFFLSFSFQETEYQ